VSSPDLAQNEIGEARLRPGAAVRHANSAICLRVLREAAEPLTVTEIADSTGLSRPTVDAVLTELGRHQVIKIEPASTRQGAGRPARQVIFDAAAGHVAGVDVGSNSIKTIVSDLAGAVVSQTVTSLPKHLDGGTRLAALRGSLPHALQEAAVPPSSLRAACVAVPGILDHEDRIARSLTVPEWVGYPLVSALQTGWGCPVAVENDIKLAALAEHRLGTDRSASTLTFLQIGHRVSLALIMNGTILQGSHRLAGELGSLRGMKWTATSARGQLRWRSAATAKGVFALAADGDPRAQREIEDFCAEIAPKIATIILTVDPDLVVIGGGLSRAGRHFLEPLTNAVHHLLMTPDKPALLPSNLTSDGAVCGALGLAFERWSTEIFGVAGMPPPWPAWRPEAVPRTSETTSPRSPQREKAR
jgi:predicted NBD/HSP70 family sugar kinase